MTNKRESILRLLLPMLILLSLAYLAFQLIPPLASNYAIKAIAVEIGLSAALLLNALYFFKKVRHKRLKQLITFVLILSAILMATALSMSIAERLKLVYLSQAAIVVMSATINLLIYLFNNKRSQSSDI